jgi:hypothetical protein
MVMPYLVHPVTVSVAPALTMGSVWNYLLEMWLALTVKKDIPETDVTCAKMVTTVTPLADMAHKQLARNVSVTEILTRMPWPIVILLQVFASSVSTTQPVTSVTAACQALMVMPSPCPKASASHVTATDQEPSRSDRVNLCRVTPLGGVGARVMWLETSVMNVEKAHGISAVAMAVSPVTVTPLAPTTARVISSPDIAVTYPM